MPAAGMPTRAALDAALKALPGYLGMRVAKNLAGTDVLHIAWQNCASLPPSASRQCSSAGVPPMPLRVCEPSGTCLGIVVDWNGGACVPATASDQIRKEIESASGYVGTGQGVDGVEVYWRNGKPIPTMPCGVSVHVVDEIVPYGAAGMLGQVAPAAAPPPPPPSPPTADWRGVAAAALLAGFVYLFVKGTSGPRAPEPGSSTDPMAKYGRIRSAWARA